MNNEQLSVFKLDNLLSGGRFQNLFKTKAQNDDVVKSGCLTTVFSDIFISTFAVVTKRNVIVRFLMNDVATHKEQMKPYLHNLMKLNTKSKKYVEVKMFKVRPNSEIQTRI